MQQTPAGPVEDNLYISTEREDNALVFAGIVAIFTVGSIVSFLGIWSNIFSMVIFYRLGLKDSMSVELFALSFTDFLVAIIQLVSCVCYIVGIFYPDSHVDILSLTTLVFGYSMGCVYFVSCWITTLISIERCFCVVYPFKVKAIFTRPRCISLILIIYAIFICIHVPVYVVFRVQWIEITSIVNSQNSSSTLVWLLTVIVNDETVLLEETYDLTMTVTMTLVIQVIVIVCALWMGYSLQVSSRVRHTNIDRPPSLESPKIYRPLSAKLASTLSTREKRLIKVVLLLAIMVIVGNVPKFVLTGLYHVLLPGMTGLTLQYVSTIIWATSSLSIAIGSSTNFLVYLNLNTSYKELFYQLCHIGRCKQ